MEITVRYGYTPKQSMSVRDGQTDTVTRLLTDTINGTIQQEQSIYIHLYLPITVAKRNNNNKYNKCNFIEQHILSISNFKTCLYSLLMKLRTILLYR